MNAEMLKITRYVNAVADLVEQIESDLRAGRSISDASMLKLSLLKDAADSVAKILDDMGPTNTKLQ